MEYFKHTYNGIEYEFKPCRRAQVKIDEIRNKMRADIPDEIRDNLSKISREYSVVEKKINELKAEYDTAAEGRKAEIDKESEPLIDKLNELSLKMTPVYENIYSAKTTQEIMYILLDEAKNPDGSSKYNINRELFDKICDSIYDTYGAEQYYEICEAIAEDCFTMRGATDNTERPRAEFLKNRKKR